MTTSSATPGIDRTAALRPDLLIVFGAGEDASLLKLLRAGADGVNRRRFGGARIAAFISRPRVTNLLDAVMPTTRHRAASRGDHLSANSALVGLSLSEAEVRDRTGSLALALHDASAGVVSDAGAEW